jgi:hypothetical protein
MSFQSGELLLAETPWGLAAVRFVKSAIIVADCSGHEHIVSKADRLTDSGLSEDEQAVIASAFEDSMESVQKGVAVMKTWAVRTKKE